MTPGPDPRAVPEGGRSPGRGRATPPPAPPAPGPNDPYPESGVVPFRGISYLLAPVALLYPRWGDIFAVARELYGRVLSRAHSVCAPTAGPYARPGGPPGPPSPGLPGLTALTESLVQDADPGLYWHLRTVGASPARVAAPWLFSGFAGYLEPQQLLLLWDRVVGYGSLVPAAVLAAGIVVFRRALLLACQSAEEVGVALEDVRGVQAVPVMQVLMAAGE